MKVSQLIGLDCRIEENIKHLEEALKRLPFFSEEDPAPGVNEIEIAIRKIQKKYPVLLSYLNCYHGLNEDEPMFHYSAMIKRMDNHAHAKTVYGLTLWETLAKAVLFMYAFIKNTDFTIGGKPK